MLTSLLKWAAIPALLVGSVFSGFAGAYEPLVNFVVCMGAIILVQRAVWLHQYVSGAGFLAIAVVFSPISLVVKIFLLLGLASVAGFSAVLAGFRSRSLAAVSVTE
jgi:hypothetical protein